jgi:hypothetical protein
VRSRIRDAAQSAWPLRKACVTVVLAGRRRRSSGRLAETPPTAAVPHTDLRDWCPHARRWRPIHSRSDSATRAALSPGTLGRHVSVHLGLRDHLRSCGSHGLCRVDITFDHSNISDANEIAGSQSGSQRGQILGYVKPQSASISAAKHHVRPRLAPSGYGPNVPSKQRVAGPNPARRTSPEADIRVIRKWRGGGRLTSFPAGQSSQRE